MKPHFETSYTFDGGSVFAGRAKTPVKDELREIVKTEKPQNKIIEGLDLICQAMALRGQMNNMLFSNMKHPNNEVDEWLRATFAFGGVARAT